MRFLTWRNTPWKFSLNFRSVHNGVELIGFPELIHLHISTYIYTSIFLHFLTSRPSILAKIAASCRPGPTSYNVCSYFDWHISFIIFCHCTGSTSCLGSSLKSKEKYIRNWNRKFIVGISSLIYSVFKKNQKEKSLSYFLISSVDSYGSPVTFE